MNTSEFQAHTEQIERLVQRASALTDEDARTTALELLRAIMDLHGAAVSRIIDILSDSGEAGRSSRLKLGSDPLICGLLVLYGVHPLSLQERVTRAIEKVGPQLRKQSGSVELLDVSDAVVRVKLQSSGNGCGSSPDALKSLIEQAIREAAPEIVEIIAEGLPTSASGFVPVNMIQQATKEETNYEESTA